VDAEMRTVFGLLDSLSVLGSCLVLLATLMSCNPAPMTNTVAASATSPDGKLTAILVDRYLHAARVSDGFFLIVIPRGQSPAEAINARNIGDSSALVATSANKVQLRWGDAGTLVVVCDSCGLHAIDISKKLDQIGSTKIVYEGFPKHTAYSSPILFRLFGVDYFVTVHSGNS
jgi:hypothetical protein